MKLRLRNVALSGRRHSTLMGVAVVALEKERCNCHRENFMTRACHSSLENKLKIALYRRTDLLLSVFTIVNCSYL